MNIPDQVVLNCLERDDMQLLLERHGHRVYDFMEDEELRTQLRTYMEKGEIEIEELST